MPKIIAAANTNKNKIKSSTKNYVESNEEEIRPFWDKFMQRKQETEWLCNGVDSKSKLSYTRDMFLTSELVKKNLKIKAKGLRRACKVNLSVVKYT